MTLTYRFRISFANTFCDDFGITVFVARVFAILTLISRSIFEEFATKGTTHDLIELLHDEFMAVNFVHFFFSLTDCTLTT
jgi:hypothetical protein